MDKICIICGKAIKEKYRKTLCSNKCAKIRKRQRINILREKKTKIVDKWKIEQGCSICGYNKCPICLDLHHKGKKNFRFRSEDIYSYIKNGNKRVKKELSRCILLCKNCHYELHNKEGSWNH